jgi:hypothetical protein
MKNSNIGREKYVFPFSKRRQRKHSFMSITTGTREREKTLLIIYSFMEGNRKLQQKLESFLSMNSNLAHICWFRKHAFEKGNTKVSFSSQIVKILFLYGENVNTRKT